MRKGQKPEPPWVARERAAADQYYDTLGRTPPEKSLDPTVSREYPTRKPWYSAYL